MGDPLERMRLAKEPLRRRAIHRRSIGWARLMPGLGFRLAVANRRLRSRGATTVRDAASNGS